MTRSVRATLDWVFRSRVTGGIVVAQWPNTALASWITASLVRSTFRPSAPWSTWLSSVASVALLVWAGDELARGVNPWRRTLGGAVLVALIVTWAAAGMPSG